MNKTKFKEVVKKIQEAERPMALDPEVFEDCTPAERKQAEKEFDDSFKKVKNVDDLMDVLDGLGYDYRDMLERVINVLAA